MAAPAEQAPEGSASAEGSAHAEETNQTETPKEDVVADVKSHDAAAEPAASAAAVAETPPDPVGDTHPVAAYDPVAALVGGALEKATADVATAQPVAPVEETAPTAPEEPIVAATAPPPTTPPFDPVAALVGGALLKAGAKGVPSAETTTSVGEPTPEVVGEPARPAATPTPTSPPEEKERKKSSGGFFGRLWNGGGSKDLKIEDGSGAIGAAADPVAPIDDTVGAFALGNAKDGFGSPVATSGPGSPVEVGSPEGEREEEGGEGTQAGTVVYTAAPSATEATAVPEAPEATAVPAVPEVAPAAAGEAQPVAEVPVPATPASASANGVVAFPAAAPASNPDPTTSSPPPPARAMSPAEIAKSANVLELLQARMASPEKPMAPRLLSRADALSVCVHASSALVPNSSIVSPVVRMHLVDPEMGAPVRPSGEASTPIQTAPFDLSARRNATFAAEWEETLEVEEALGDIMAVGAIVLFEVLQPPPSFQYFEERAASFPGGQPMRLAWGFLKLLRGADGKPNMGRLKVQLYKWEDRPAQAGVMGAVAAVVGGGGVSGVSAAPNAPDVFRVWKKASILTPALRHLYPAHLNVTIGSSPRGDVVAALLSAARPGVETPRLAIAPPPVPRMASLSGLGDDENSAFTQRPSRRERIDHERALGGGWRNAQARLQRAPQGDQSEIVTRLGRLPHETLCYGMDPVSAVAAAAAQAVADAETATPGLSGSTSWKTLPGMKRTIVRLPHARSKQEACLLPNTVSISHLPHFAD